MMQFTETLMLDLESQAKLELSPAERADYARDMQAILDEIDAVPVPDTEGVEPLPYVYALGNVFREDAVRPSVDRDLLLAGAPRQKDGCVQVPKTVES